MDKRSYLRWFAAAAVFPLLAVGKDIFSNLQDESGKPCGERQRELFWQTLGELEPEIALADGGTEEEGLAEPEREQREGTRGEFLAAVEEDGIYMDQEQMKNWLNGQGVSWSIRAVCLKIQSREYAQLARDALEKAGYTVKIREG